MRTKKSILNMCSNFLILSLRTIMTFVVRTVFIKILGGEYLGIDGLFTNILSMLSLADLGIGIAINHSLYEPLAHKDIKKISILMSFYKKLYAIIGITITILGLCLIPFLNIFIKNIEINNIILIYILYLFNTVSLYFISYKETLIIADQDNYKLTKITFVSYMAMYILQILLLLVTHNFIIYLLTQIIILFVQRVFINRYITKKYNYINFKSNDKLEKNELNKIKTNIKSIIFYKLGNFSLNSTDNLIISSFISVPMVGLYTNYLSITTMLSSLISSICRGVTASFGNLIVLETEETQEKTFDIINFICCIAYGYVSICILILINPFVEIWIGTKYLLPFYIILTLVLIFYLNGLMTLIISIKDAAGAYKQDRYSTIIQAIVNLILSIILVQFFGLLGVLLGTLISIILVPLWNRPYMIYKHVFKSSPKKYFSSIIFNILINILLYLFINYIIDLIGLKLSLLNLFVEGVFITLIYFISIIIIYFHNKNFKQCMTLFVSLVKNRR